MSSQEYREGEDQELEEGSDQGSGGDADLPDAAAADWAPPSQQPSDQQGAQGDQQERQEDPQADQGDQVGEGGAGAALVEGAAKDWGDGADPATVTVDANLPSENGDAQASADVDPVDPPTEAGVDEPGKQPGLDKAGQEEQLRELDIKRMEPVDVGGHANDVQKVELANGDFAYFKAGRAENNELRDSIPDGEQHKREVATYELDKALGFDLVPPTAFRTHADLGAGSIQAEAPGPNRAQDEYGASDQMKMAVLDYVAGNTDRHGNNHLSQVDGRPAAIDNGLTFPEDESDSIRSSWVTDVLFQEIDSETLAQVRAVDRDQLAGRWRECGLSDAAIDGALRRLEEVQEEGSITGRTWGGKVCDKGWNTFLA